MQPRGIAAAAVAAALVLGVTSVAPGAADVANPPAQRSSPAATATERAPLRAFDVRWRRVVSGLSAPTEVTSAPDGRKRLFVVEKGGTVRVVQKGNVVGRPYLSIGGRIDASGEGGLLSVAFSPTFRRDGLLFLTYVSDGDGDLVVGRMKAPRPGATHVRARTLRTVLRVDHPVNDNHYGGQLAFDSQRRLYVGVGDGGGGGDPFNAAGDRSDLRGKILRVDPFSSCADRRYCVPSDNPFVGRKGKDEIWLMGLRNPWRFSIDPRTQKLWIGDVGQDAWEEVDVVGPNPRRIHLGWSCKEGRATYNATRCRPSVDYLAPAAVVPHPQGESITGGYVYRGERYRARIGGAYVFADFVTRRVWLYREGTGKVLQDTRLGTGGGPTSFGRDDRGEIYAVTYDGVLWRMHVRRG